MPKVVNLNRFRKEKSRADKRAKGDANAAKFGRTKAEKQMTEAQREKDVRSLDGHKRDRDDT